MATPEKIERNLGIKVIEKMVKSQGSGAHVNVPKEWLGQQVRVILLSRKDWTGRKPASSRPQATK